MLYYHSFGALAQLGARHTGSVEVTGSNPVCSTERYAEGFLRTIFLFETAGRSVIPVKGKKKALPRSETCGGGFKNAGIS